MTEDKPSYDVQGAGKTMALMKERVTYELIHQIKRWHDKEGVGYEIILSTLIRAWIEVYRDVFFGGGDGRATEDGFCATCQEALDSELRREKP